MEKTVTSVWILRAPYFQGKSGTYRLAAKGQELVLEVDDAGRFEIESDSKLPVGIFARLVK